MRRHIQPFALLAGTWGLVGCATPPAGAPAVIRPAKTAPNAATGAKVTPPALGGVAKEAPPQGTAPTSATSVPPNAGVAPSVEAAATRAMGSLTGVVRVPRPVAAATALRLLAATEAPAARVPVEVLAGNGAAAIATTTTDAEGRYVFATLPRGRTYQVRAQVEVGGKRLTLRSLAGLGEAEATEDSEISAASTVAAARLLQGVTGEAMALLEEGAFEEAVKQIGQTLELGDLSFLEDERAVRTMLERLQPRLQDAVKQLERLAAALRPVAGSPSASGALPVDLGAIVASGAVASGALDDLGADIDEDAEASMAELEGLLGEL